MINVEAYDYKQSTITLCCRASSMCESVSNYKSLITMNNATCIVLSNRQNRSSPIR